MKQKWKNLTIVVLTLFLLGGLVACGEQEEENSAVSGAFYFGDTVKTKKKADPDGKLHEISWKATKVLFEEKDVDEVIEKYNVSGAAQQIAPVEEEDTAYRVVQYEVKYPESFPTEEYGVDDAPLKFQILAADGGELFQVERNGKTVTYEGMNETWEVGIQPQAYDFYPPRTYKGAIAFILPKGVDDFLIKEYYKDGEEEVAHYVVPREKEE